MVGQTVMVALALVLAVACAQDPEPQAGNPSNVPDMVGATEVPSIPSSSVESNAKAEVASPTATPTVNPLDLIANVRCEVAVAQLNSDALKVQSKITVAQAKLANETLKLEEANKVYNQAVARGSRAGSVEFGQKYLALRSKMKELRNRDVDDSSYKEEYITDHNALPNLERLLNATVTDVTVGRANLLTMTAKRENILKEIKGSKKNNKILSVQFPLNKEILDNRYAKDLVSGKSRVAYLEKEVGKEEQRELAGQKTLGPLANALKPLEGKLTADKGAVIRLKRDWRKTTEKLVAEHKVNVEAQIILKEQLEELKGHLQRHKTIELKNQQLAATMEQTKQQDAENKIAKAEVKAENVAEKHIEADEKAEDTKPVAEESEDEAEQRRLLEQKAKMQEEVRKRVLKAQESAAKEVNTVKEKFVKKLQAEKDSANNKTPKDPINDKLSQEKAAVENLSQELRKSVNNPFA